MDHRMVEVMHWFYRLTVREKCLVYFSLIAMLSGVWLYITESLEQEKQWYWVKINTHLKAGNQLDQFRAEDNSLAAYVEHKDMGNILNLIKDSLEGKDTLQFLSVDINANDAITIKLKGDFFSLYQYLSGFNESYPSFHWDYIDYRRLDSDGVLEIKAKFYKSMHGHL